MEILLLKSIMLLIFIQTATQRKQTIFTCNALHEGTKDHQKHQNIHQSVLLSTCQKPGLAFKKNFLCVYFFVFPFST